MTTTESLETPVIYGKDAYVIVKNGTPLCYSLTDTCARQVVNQLVAEEQKSLREKYYEVYRSDPFADTVIVSVRRHPGYFFSGTTSVKSTYVIVPLKEARTNDPFAEAILPLALLKLSSS